MTIVYYQSTYNNTALKAPKQYSNTEKGQTCAGLRLSLCREWTEGESLEGKRRKANG